MCTTRPGSLNGRPPKKRSLIKLKIAVFRPIPRASVRTARQVKAGDFRSWRRANRRSFISLCAQSFDWIDMRSAARREKTGKECGGSQHHAGNEKGEWIAWADFV